MENKVGQTAEKIFNAHLSVILNDVNNKDVHMEILIRKAAYGAMEEYASKKLEEYRKGLSTSQGWVSVNERLPERVPNKNYSQVQCLVNKRYEWKRGDNSGVYYQIQILTFNHEHECWDGEDGDDHDCAIDQVTHWMPLPPRPESEQI